MDRIARIAPSARLEQQIEELLTSGLGDKSEHLTELGRLGARLVLQRIVKYVAPVVEAGAKLMHDHCLTGDRQGAPGTVD